MFHYNKCYDYGAFINMAFCNIIIISIHLLVFSNGAFCTSPINTEYGDGEEETCTICFEQPSIVIVKPCNHKICNRCANILNILKMFPWDPILCPWCVTKISHFDGIVKLETCKCKKELPTVTLKPCNHKIGNNCAIEKEKVYLPKCSQCNSEISSYDGLINEPYTNEIDDETLFRDIFQDQADNVLFVLNNCAYFIKYFLHLFRRN
ncbi:uncharacterized protein LOC126907319 [Daktulosphaira vitifoliae]|uniref:uncharacterized protein LOC126907319 n=1 Tax=Daktulosphaira vitifoliae TaxID=58002 RepID=UPI0021A9BFA3|nr:uncharacterized protein LOC126907319 [Daktulosphaira vitifoliae]XP_050544467.1 uncharacterized protein LOC126907319 [Daktulosphaira vitifoliae]